MSYVGFRAWMDGDNIHVWQGHVCTDGIVTSKLPHSQLKRWVASMGLVVPSIHCEKCGQHESNVKIDTEGAHGV